MCTSQRGGQNYIAGMQYRTAVNIIKLESYITDNSFTVAQFYAEVLGHPGDKPVDRALEELQYFSTKLRILGTYPVSEFRPT